MKPTTLAFLLALAVACASRQTQPLNAGHDQQSQTAATQRDGARNAAVSFYTEVRRDRIEGLPDTAQLRRLSPYLTPEMVAKFQRASKVQADYMRQHPDDKGPWAEGDLFSSLFEGVNGWTLGAAQVSGDTAEVPVQLTYRGEDKETVKWSDTLVLKQTSSGWRVADVVMGGKWAFKAGGNRLSDTLSAKP